MILLITSSADGPRCADALRAATGLETHWAQTLQEAASRLREQTYSAAVIDQFLLETDPAESDQMIEHLGTAFPVYLNFAITGMERLVREVRSALHRRKREEGAARRAVETRCAAKCARLSLPCSSPANLRCRCLRYPARPWKKFESSTAWPANFASAWK